jgi:hypothetical protein
LLSLAGLASPTHIPGPHGHDHQDVRHPDDHAHRLLSQPGFASPSYILYHPAGSAQPAWSSGSAGGATPAQITHAYGFDHIALSNGAAGNGSGQTIAIVDAYDDPNIQSDLNAFDTQFQLASTTLTTVWVYSQGESSTPVADPTGNWEVEESLDVEWAHAIAPGANIVLVEANSSSPSDLFTAVNVARNWAGVSVVSMSWGFAEFSGETSLDTLFTTPPGHQPVTFVAASGDSGTISYPAASPNVVAVGGTTLMMDGRTTLTSGAQGNYISETPWSHSGGGVSGYETEPAYQQAVQGTGRRTNPDVAYAASIVYPATASSGAITTGYTIYDSYTGGSATPWAQVGGTSAGAPQWAALFAIANQARAVNNLPAINSTSPQQALGILYKISNGGDFHYITTRSSSRYNLVTGLGTPHADYLIQSVAATSTLTSQELFVRGLYQDFLGRDGSKAELDYWVGQLPTLGQSGVANDVARSTEALNRVVNQIYLAFLGRAADSVGLSYWESLLQNGYTEEYVMSQILGSTEFQARANVQMGYPGLQLGTYQSNYDFVAALYQDVLERSASATEIQGWFNTLPSLGYSGVAYYFVTSTEFRNDGVRTSYGDATQALPFQPFFPDLVKRYLSSSSPSSAEVAGWVNSGMDFLSMEIAFASTAEYYNVPRS